MCVRDNMQFVRAHTFTALKGPKLNFARWSTVKNMSEKRAYNWRLVSYASEEEIKEFCKKYGSKWEYIYHDKDIKEDGSPKEPHYHINITLKEWKSRKKICELIESEYNTFGIEMTDKEKAHRYLTHEDNPEKYQYDKELIKSNFKWKDSKGEKASNEDFIKIAMDKNLSYREKGIILGKDYMKNHKAYTSYMYKIEAEESESGIRQKRLNWCIEEIKYRYSLGENLEKILRNTADRLRDSQLNIITEEKNKEENEPF